MIDIIKLNIILYYADYLAIRNNSRQVTDNCKYYYIYGAPINIAYLYNSSPFYDTEDKYYIQSHNELLILTDKVGLEEVKNFVNAICNIKVMGCIDAKTMLDEAHQFSTNADRSTAFRDYNKWLKSQRYTHLQMNDVGDIERVVCTRHVAHSEYGTNNCPQVEYITKKGGKQLIRIQKYTDINHEKDEQTYKVDEETSI